MSETLSAMRTPPISKLPADERHKLLDDLNYLNIAEIKSFCCEQSIPYMIAIKTADGGERKTNEADRKGVVLNRIRHFLQTGEVLKETCFDSSVVCFESLRKTITPNHKLFYGQYDQKNRAMISLLKNLTNGQFRDGAIARMVARAFWTAGKAPTFSEFASGWMRSAREHRRPNPEWAFLAGRARGTAGADWKKLRAVKVAWVLTKLEEIVAKPDRPIGSQSGLIPLDTSNQN
jgi:hypothetical protein